MSALAADPIALDDWLAGPLVRTHHRRTAGADPAALWRAAQGIRLRDTRALGRLVRWRIPGLAGDLTYHRMLREDPFCVLAEGEHVLLSGLCGRIWTLTRDYPHLDGPEAFRAWDEPGTVKVLFAHWTRALSAGRSEIVSEARVAATDTQGRLRLKATWAVVGPWERLVGSEPLAQAVRGAER